jgi:hypothetical protein
MSTVNPGWKWDDGRCELILRRAFRYLFAFRFCYIE